MTDLITAAQQALEALEAMQSYAAAERKGLRICDEAIPALRAALAQQAEPVKPVAWANIDSDRLRVDPATGNVSIGAQQAEPVEPVAWVGDPSTQDYASTVPDTQIADRLARHGINPCPDRLARHGIPKP